ncbi:envelope stress response membrane protein PspC [Aliikangiella sp. G2MR2-5]|uniref:envelope stress response membrane protein PspC n=1 Tax=Aliikangiella sp. G2MR2-5 TaxID=2788943 RepID=UPI0018AB5431|nr:envelope stress response membrane protein PspC [Aliikangiella sp. G2MR2-5]
MTPNSDFSGSGRKLYKKPDDAKICGICSGIAEYLGFETWVVRIIAVSLLLFANGAAVLGYIILCFVLDEKPGSKKGKASKEKKRTHFSTGEPDNSQPYNPTVKDVWRSGSSPQEMLSNIESKFSKIEKKLQSMESFVTSKQYELEKEFNKMES